MDREFIPARAVERSTRLLMEMEFEMIGDQEKFVILSDALRAVAEDIPYERVLNMWLTHLLLIEQIVQQLMLLGGEVKGNG